MHCYDGLVKKPALFFLLVLLVFLFFVVDLLFASGHDRIPTDEASLNEFAAAYNDYANSLKYGIIDQRKWKRVVKTWDSLK